MTKYEKFYIVVGQITSLLVATIILGFALKFGEDLAKYILTL